MLGDSANRRHELKKLHWSSAQEGHCSHLSRCPSRVSALSLRHSSSPFPPSLLPCLQSASAVVAAADALGASLSWVLDVLDVDFFLLCETD